MVKKARKQLNKNIENISNRLTRWIGTTQSLIFHSLFFTGSLSLVFLGFNSDQILLVLTTVVSLEAIYLSIFIQMTVNRNTQSLAEVEADIDEIQEDVDEIQEDVEGLEEEFDEMSDDIEEIQAEEVKDDRRDVKRDESLDKIQTQLQILLKELELLKQTDQTPKRA